MSRLSFPFFFLVPWCLLSFCLSDSWWRGLSLMMCCTVHNILNLEYCGATVLWSRQYIIVLIQQRTTLPDFMWHHNFCDVKPLNFHFLQFPVHLPSFSLSLYNGHWPITPEHMGFRWQCYESYESHKPNNETQQMGGAVHNSWIWT